MTALYHLAHRFSTDVETLERVRAVCSRGSKTAWVGSHDNGQSLRIHTFRGVSGSQIDVLLPDVGTSRSGQMTYRRDNGAEVGPWLLACSVGRKEGSYDGNVRWRLTFADLMPLVGAGQPVPRGKLYLDEHPDGLSVVAHWGVRGECWAQSFAQMPWQTDADVDRAGILVALAQRYFRHLWPHEAEQVRAVAVEWASRAWIASEGDVTILHRSASEELRQLSGHLGWVRLTSHQRARIGLGGEWQRVERVLAERVRVGIGTTQGVGEYTLAAANGERLSLPVGVCRHCEQLDCECQE